MRIVTDSASDLLESEAKIMDVAVVPLEIRFEEELITGNTEEIFQGFYARLEESPVFPVTSQPSPELFVREIERAKEAGEEVLILTISSGLSGTYNSAMNAKAICGYAPVVVFDTQQATVMERLMVEYAVKLRNEGKSLDELVPLLTAYQPRVQGHGYLASLTYLKKGGRIPASVAALGNMLHLKPIFTIADGKITCTSKKRGEKAAAAALLDQVERAKLKPEDALYFGYAGVKEPVAEFEALCQSKLGFKNTRLYPVGGTIGAHTGPRAVVVAFVTEE